jgi:DNA-binding SARP family transcriptional activator
LEFCILGPLEVWDGAHQVQVLGTKQRALLAILLVHANQVVSTDRLIDELWDGDSRDTSTGALRVRVHELRKALGGHTALVTRPPGYLIRVESDRLDLHRFERLLEEGRRSLEAGAPGDASRLLGMALGLWRGPPLVDVAYEQFAQPVIARLEELRLVALELRIEAELALGRHAQLVGELDALVAEHPLRERLHGLRMLALYRSDRQGEALEAYRSLRIALAAGLGLEPSATLRELEQAILRQDPSLNPLQRQPGRAVETSTTRAILVAALDEVHLDGLLAVAEPLARDSTREIILTRLVPEAGDLGPAAAQLRARCDLLAQRGAIARAAVHTSARPGSDLVRLAMEQDVDLLLLCASRSLIETGIPGGDLSTVLAGAPCDVAVHFAGGPRRDGPVLVPFGGADHDWAAVELAAWVARARQVPLRLLGSTAVPEAGKRDASRLLSHASLVVHRGLGIAAEPMLVTAGEDGILEASADAGLLVVGLSSRWHREGVGAARLALAREARCPVLLVRRGLRPGGLSPRASLTRFTWSIRAAA